jgi:MYXO-CTERM domain-containing protein
MNLQTLLMSGGALYLVSMTWFTALPARAHISMVGTLQSRGGDEKEVPCDGAQSSGPVYTFEPGATIKLELQESIPHPSYFRIAFDHDGQDNFVEPKSIDPKDVDPSRPCPYNADDQCGPGKSDYCNVKSTTGGPAVLWDNLDPHSASESQGSYTWTIALPNVECETCTLQVIQVMEDTVHGAYCPAGSCATECTSIIPGVSLCSDGSAQDVYHRCINIKLKRGAGNTPGTSAGSAPTKGLNCLTGQTTDAGVPHADASVGNDASTGSDAGVPGATVGGTAGGVTPGGTTTGGTTGGIAGGIGGVTGGAAGGTGTAGGVAGTAGGSMGIADGGATIGGTAGAGTAGGLAGGTTSGTVPPGDDAPNDDGCDCAVSSSSPKYGNLIGMSLLALALLARRRRYGQ